MVIQLNYLPKTGHEHDAADLFDVEIRDFAEFAAHQQTNSGEL